MRVFRQEVIGQILWQLNRFWACVTNFGKSHRIAKYDMLPLIMMET